MSNKVNLLIIDDHQAIIFSYKNIIIPTINRILFVIIFCVLVSCKDKLNHTTQDEITTSSFLNIKDTINFNIPDSIPSPFSRSNLYWNSNEHYVGFVGDINNNEIQIQVLDIEKKNWFSIKLRTEGEQQVYGMGNFSFNGDKSITYLPSITPKILKINFQGEVISNQDFSKKYTHANNNAIFNPDIALFDSKAGFLSLEYLNMDNVDNYELAHLYTIYDYANDKAVHIINFPEEFIGQVWSANDQDMSAIFNKEKLIFSFSKSHSLYVYNTIGELQEKVNVRVKGVGDAKPLQKGNDDAMRNMLRTEATGKYSSLIYDKWRNIYYRIGTFYDTPAFDPKNFNEISAMRHKLTYVIVTLNETFQVLGSDYFDHIDTNINSGSYFVNKDGLYMNLRNTEDENTLSYVRLGLIEK